MSEPVSLWPIEGFQNSRPRQEVGIAALTATSTNWLTGRKRLRRRAGSAVYGDTWASNHETTGILESKWSALARRIVSAVLPSSADGYATPLVLYTAEGTKRATLGFRSTNSTGSWRTVAKEFSATHYPASGVPNHRVVPMVYRNQYGGLTFHRLTSITDREHMCSGSRSIVQTGGRIAWPSPPHNWDGNFNDATGSGTNAYHVFPTGLIPPLQMPLCTPGNDLGASTPGPFKGSNAWYFSVCFENDKGELSMFTVPRAPGSAYVAFPGFGYVQVSTANPTHWFDSMVYSHIPQGPPGTKWIHLLRSSMVDVATTGAGAIVQPAQDNLQFFAKLAQGTTSYIDAKGNDLGLDPDFRIGEMVTGGLHWPASSKYVGHFDGRVTLGNSRQTNPYAMLIAPWANGKYNLPIGDAGLYGPEPSFVAVTPTQLVLRRVSVTGATTKPGTLNSAAHPTKIGLADITGLLIGNTVSGTDVPANSVITSLDPYVDTGCVFTSGNTTIAVTDSTNIRKGQGVTDAAGKLPAGTVVSSITDATHVVVSQAPTANVAPDWVSFVQITINNSVTGSHDLETLTFGSGTADLTFTLAGMTLLDLVDRITRNLNATTTTFTGCKFLSGTLVPFPYIIDLGAAPTGLAVGDLVVSSAFPAGTRILSISPLGVTNYIGVSNSATRANYGSGESITFTREAQGTDYQWGAQVVPGADPFALATSLLTTVVPSASSTFTAGQSTVTVGTLTDALYISPGMGAYGTGIGTGAIVTAVNAGTGVVTVSVANSGSGPGTVTFAYDTGDSALAGSYGYIRTFGNAFPVALPWGTAYLDQFADDEQKNEFSAGSPGYAQDGLNTWLERNKHRGPDAFGRFMGMAAIGPAEVHFYAKGKMRLWNPRTGLTRADQDYTETAVDWVRGCCSPYSIVSGNGWAVYASREGLFGRGEQQMVSPYSGATIVQEEGERLLSKAIYDPGRPVGERGELEYAITASVAAAEAGTDAFRIACSVENGVLFVRYFSSSTATYFDREIRYDFSAGEDRSGLAELVDENGAPYPWSAPIPRPASCSCVVAKADGLHHYAAIDTNAGTADGRVDEIDTGTTDNGNLVVAVGFTGLKWPSLLGKIQATILRLVYRKQGSGLSVSVTREPEKEPDAATWDPVTIGSTGADGFGRCIAAIKGEASDVRTALGLRILDDGVGPCPDISLLTVDAAEVPWTKEATR